MTKAGKDGESDTANKLKHLQASNTFVVIPNLWNKRKDILI